MNGGLRLQHLNVTVADKDENRILSTAIKPTGSAVQCFKTCGVSRGLRAVAEPFDFFSLCNINGIFHELYLLYIGTCVQNIKC